MNSTSTALYAILYNMIQDESSNTPHIGQTLDYYPDENTRVPALCIQVHPADSINRPFASLQIFWPNGELSHEPKVPPAIPSVTEEPELKGRWGFSHEFNISSDPSKLQEEELGTETNRHVGLVGPQPLY